MGGAPLQELQEGLAVYKDELFADTLARKRVEIAIVTFGGTVQVAQQFVTPEFFTPPTLAATGDTPMAASSRSHEGEGAPSASSTSRASP